MSPFKCIYVFLIIDHEVTQRAQAGMNGCDLKSSSESRTFAWGWRGKQNKKNHTYSSTLTSQSYADDLFYCTRVTSLKTFWIRHQCCHCTHVTSELGVRCFRTHLKWKCYAIKIINVTDNCNWFYSLWDLRKILWETFLVGYIFPLIYMYMLLLFLKRRASTYN